MEKLREEILQSESVRSDLLKWKLALIGGIGAAGLGFAGSNELRHADLVLCVIPPVCVYVDLLCMHLNLKMLVIGTFQSQWRGGDSTAGFSAYERFVEQQARRLSKDERISWRPGAVLRRGLMTRGRDRSAFELEDWALSLSTLALSLALLIYAILLHSRFSIPFAISGVASLVATAIGSAQFEWRFNAVRKLRLADARQ
jgi:hypothetical protein